MSCKGVGRGPNSLATKAAEPKDHMGRFNCTPKPSLSINFYGAVPKTSLQDIFGWVKDMLMFANL